MAETCAIPEPINPQPSTPTFLIAISKPFQKTFNHGGHEGTQRKANLRFSESEEFWWNFSLKDFVHLRVHCGEWFQFKLSTITAMPWPPPMHAVASPNFFLRRRSSYSSVMISRVPV